MGCRRNTIARVSILLILDLRAAGAVLSQGLVSHYFWTYGLQEEYYSTSEYLTTSGPMGCRRSTISRVSISLLVDLQAAGGVLFQGLVSYYFWTYWLQEEYYFKGEYFTTSAPMGCRRSTISRVSVLLLLDLWPAEGVLFQG